MIPSVDHDCVLKEFVVELANRVAKLERENAQLKKAHIGPKSERTKMPRIHDGKTSTPADRLAKRRARAEERAQIQTAKTEHKVPEAQRTCPSCGNTTLKPLGKGKTTVVWEFIPATFIRHEHVQEVLRCKCANYVVTADIPQPLRRELPIFRRGEQPGGRRPTEASNALLFGGERCRQLPRRVGVAVA